MCNKCVAKALMNPPAEGLTERKVEMVNGRVRETATWNPVPEEYARLEGLTRELQQFAEDRGVFNYGKEKRAGMEGLCTGGPILVPLIEGFFLMPNDECRVAYAKLYAYTMNVVEELHRIDEQEAIRAKVAKMFGKMLGLPEQSEEEKDPLADLDEKKAVWN